MSSFLIDKNSPIRTIGNPGLKEPSTRLRHRSRHSESEQEFNTSRSSSLLRQNSFQDTRKQECDISPTCACTDTKEAMLDLDQPKMHEGGYNQTKARSSKSMIGYFMSELMKGYNLEDDAREFVERRDRVYTSVYTPKNLEKFCAFGFLQCLDSILYIVTFLPLRILVALVQVITYPFSVIFLKDSRILDSAQICDLLKGVILIVSCFLTSYMDMSMIYHIVRGQSIIKFYVFYNMLDVMDKLISGFGQDVLDSLYWTAVEPRGRKREHFGTIFHLIFAIVYVVLHTMMILIQGIILNVAFNSHNKNLLTIMLSNNFVELKGNLFKRLDKNNLCQITYSDVKERFHYLVLLLFVLIRNMKELEWSWDLALPFIQDAIIVFGVEIVVDWVKHAFITKFNELSASFYDDFALGLAQDIASSRNKHAFTDFSDQVCRRMGFTPIPLICLLFMVCSKSFTINGPLPWFLVFLFYLCLVSTKVFNSIILLGWAQHLTAAVRTKSIKPSGTVVNSQVIPKKDDKNASNKSHHHPEPGNLSPLNSVEDTNGLENLAPCVESPVKSAPSLHNDNGDNSFDFIQSTPQTESLSVSHSQHDGLSTRSFDELLESGSSEQNGHVESSPKPHKPSSQDMLFQDLSSSEKSSDVDLLIQNKLEELTLHSDEKVLISESSQTNPSDCLEYPSLEKVQEETLCSDAAEPFMFKLSNSNVKQKIGDLHSMTEDVCHLDFEGCDPLKSENIGNDESELTDILPAYQPLSEEDKCVHSVLSQDENFENDYNNGEDEK